MKIIKKRRFQPYRPYTTLHSRLKRRLSWTDRASMSPARGLLAWDRDTGRSHVIAARPSGGYTKLSSHAGSQSQVTVRVSGSVSAASVFLSLRAEAAAVTVDDDAITLIGAAATVTVTAGVTLRLSAAAAAIKIQTHDRKELNLIV